MFVIFLKTNPQFQDIKLSAECRVFKDFVLVEIFYHSPMRETPILGLRFDIDIKLDVSNQIALSYFIALVSNISGQPFEFNSIKEL